MIYHGDDTKNRGRLDFVISTGNFRGESAKLGPRMSADLAVSEPSDEVRCFRNFRLSVYWAILAIACIVVFILGRHAVIGLGSVVIALFAVQAAVANLRGVIVRHDYISLPRPLLPLIPVLTLWRTRIPLAALRDVTAMGHFMGLEAVGLGTSEGVVPALFSKRQKRLDFFKALQAEKSSVKIYRSF